MNNELIDKYSYMMDCLYEIIKITNNKKLKQNCENNLISFINGLYLIEKNNRELYESLLEKYNLNKEQLKQLEKKDLPQLEKYTKEIENIFKNPNEDSIKVWLKNIISFANDNNIKEDELKKYIYRKFEVLDKNNEFKDKLEEYIIEINNNSKSEINKKSDTDIEANKLSKDKNLKEKIEDAEDYVYNHCYVKNYETLGKKLEKIMIELNTNLANNNEEGLINGTKKYLEFINDNEKMLDREKMMEHLFNTYKTQNKESLLQNYLNKERKNEDESLKILNVKNSYNSNLDNKELTLIALAELGVIVASPIFGTVLGVCGYLLYRKGIKSVRELIEKNGYSLDDNNELIDKNGKIINNEDIGKLKYSLIKRELTKLDKDDGNIDKWYKKNKLTSILLNNNIVKNIKKDYEQIKETNMEKDSPELSDINKGMRLIK